MKQTGKKSPRNKLIALVHIAAQHLDIEYNSAEYRTWLEKLSGETSCKDLTNEQLTGLVDRLRREGCLEQKKTGSAPNRPTLGQWRKMEILTRQLGFNHKNDAGFVTFVKRVTKLDDPRFLTRQSISKVIVGLEKWLEYEKKQKNNFGESEHAKKTPLNTR
ncbi:regulatory protein GemA [Nitrosomonas marina]|uniref:Mu-like prophage protein gp16 n=1 Tax=Nitrosomonas marina TaxID=917 RepID=A0A1H8FVN1_9PROT|nr:regulatory protein GemA [Nitrosomonas marina]SEN35881.1 Protein of unknown function [Nitrosomonas marina]